MGKTRDVSEYIGDTAVSLQGYKMIIVDARNTHDIDIQFDDEYKTITRHKKLTNFYKGKIKNLNALTAFGIGYVGVGKYTSSINNKETVCHEKWYNMMCRCYDNNFKIRHPSYKECFCVEEWHNFQNFAKWYDENLWSEDCTCLDKDILIKGNKIYSSNNCILVDNRINTLFLKNNKSRGKYPIGVYYEKRDKKFVSQLSKLDEKNNKKGQRFLGYFNTPEEAFEVYKKEKESYIKQIADKYAQKYPNFPTKLYNAMYNYQVEITD